MSSEEEGQSTGSDQSGDSSPIDDRVKELQKRLDKFLASSNAQASAEENAVLAKRLDDLEKQIVEYEKKADDDKKQTLLSEIEKVNPELAKEYSDKPLSEIQSAHSLLKKVASNFPVTRDESDSSTDDAESRALAEGHIGGFDSKTEKWKANRWRVDS